MSRLSSRTPMQHPMTAGLSRVWGSASAVSLCHWPPKALESNIRENAAIVLGADPAECRLEHTQVVYREHRLPLARLGDAVPHMRHKLQASRKAYAAPRFTAFYAHGFRIAVHRVTGEIRILQSVQAIDCGTLINPMQCRGQAEGAFRFGADRAFRAERKGVGRGRGLDAPALDLKIRVGHPNVPRWVDRLQPGVRRVRRHEQ